MIKQNTYEKKNDKNKIPGALTSSREKEVKEEPIQRMDKFNSRPRKNSITTDLVDSVKLEPNQQLPST